MKTYTQADLAAAWDSGYWHGTSHAGPLNDAAINAKNPYIRENEAAAHGSRDIGGGDRD